MIGKPGQTPYAYYTYVNDSFSTNIENTDNENSILIKYQFGAGFPPSMDSELPFYEITYKVTENSKYEKFRIDDKFYLKITLAENSVELLDKKNDQIYTNDFETTFYVDITNWK